MKTGRWSSLMVLITWFTLSGSIQADTFLLRDGRCLEGSAQEDGEVLVITTYAGEVVRVPKKDVMGSTSEPVRNAFYAKLKALPAGDAQACYALGQWAVEQKLTAEARGAYEQVLRIDPGHAEARSALGRSAPATWAPPSPGDVVIAPFVQRPERIEWSEVRALAKRLSDLNDGDTAERQALLATAKERPELFSRVLKTPAQPGETQLFLRTVEFMGQAGDRRGMDALLGACFEQPDERVRRAAAKALAQLEEPSSLRKLIDVAVTPKFPWATRQCACVALRNYGDKEAIVRLLSLLSFELAGGQAGDSKNPLIKSPGGLGSEDPFRVGGENLPAGPIDERVVYPVLFAIREVTGAVFEKTGSAAKNEKDYRTWQQWWRENEAAFTFPGH